MFYKLLRILKVIRKKDFYVHRDIKRSTITLGNKNAAWTIIPHLINIDSIIYSFGTGTDISFDLAIIEKFGATVHAFDPTPKSILWIKNQQLPDKFIFHAKGLASHDGKAKFSLPDNPLHVSATILHKPDNQGFFIADVNRINTFMNELSHNRIDILKMDIEGAEYEVIDDLIASDIQVTQLLIEFHHRFQNVGVSKTRYAIYKLRKAGFSVFNVSDTGEEISFVKNHLC
jgi:FkbM family methyltransferase